MENSVFFLSTLGWARVQSSVPKVYYYTHSISSTTTTDHRHLNINNWIMCN